MRFTFTFTFLTFSLLLFYYDDEDERELCFRLSCVIFQICSSPHETLIILLLCGRKGGELCTRINISQTQTQTQTQMEILKILTHKYFPDEVRFPSTHVFPSQAGPCQRNPAPPLLGGGGGMLVARMLRYLRASLSERFFALSCGLCGSSECIRKQNALIRMIPHDPQPYGQHMYGYPPKMLM